MAPHRRGSTREERGPGASGRVCPAQAGVYPFWTLPPTRWIGLPRTRGGLPQFWDALTPWQTFAPHTRGSTDAIPALLGVGPVCPAHAGVYRGDRPQMTVRPRLPRTRGGLPFWKSMPATMIAFAPHTRGSTHDGLGSPDPLVVCPAHAGVYRLHSPPGRQRFGLPRTRGGLPVGFMAARNITEFAPHTRGSTV